MKVRPFEKEKIHQTLGSVRADIDGPSALQLHFERMILDQPEELTELARKAFSAFVRAYSTRAKEIRYIFHVKSLHLGHVAKSFALRESPGNLSVSWAQLLI